MQDQINMRDPKRIGRICKLLEEKWMDAPVFTYIYF